MIEEESISQEAADKICIINAWVHRLLHTFETLEYPVDIVTEIALILIAHLYKIARTEQFNQPNAPIIIDYLLRAPAVLKGVLKHVDDQVAMEHGSNTTKH